MDYYPIGKFAEEIGVTVQSVRNWDKSSKLKPHHVSDGGHRYYSQEQVNHYLGLHKPEAIEKIVIGYCRVSSQKQKDDLERQVENMQTYLFSGGVPFKIITDIGSGINYKNKGLNTLLDIVTDGKVEKIVVLYKDRLVRFGFELIENICHKFGTSIEVVDTTDKTEEQELVEDLIQIVTVFSCRLQRKRANKAKRMIKELISDDNDQEG
jgi:predicted site-specific integrase-resolvase